jgi:hypothetical protein
LNDWYHEALNTEIDMSDIVTTYKHAWRTMADKVVVRYHGGGGDSGKFYDNFENTNPPTIRIARRGQQPSSGPLDKSHEPSEFFSNGRPLTPEELLLELITLCHEFGHFTSFAGHFASFGEKTPSDDWKSYKAALNKMDDARGQSSDEEDQRRQVENDLTHEERGRIFTEEELAWQIGGEFFEMLDGVGADELKVFDREKNQRLDTYRFLVDRGSTEGRPAEA